MNQDESTFEIPDYILSRLQPTLQLGFPARQDELAILQYHLPFAAAEMLALTVDSAKSARAESRLFTSLWHQYAALYAMKRLARF